MVSQIKKYITTFKLTWAQATDYRFNFIFEFVCCFIPVIALLFLWQAIYFDNNVVGNYDMYMMFTYVIIARFVSLIITPGFFFDVTDEIQEGTLSNYIVKPINYIRYWFWKSLGGKSRNIITGLIPIVVVYVFYNKYFIFNCTWKYGILFILSFAFAYGIYFEIIFLVSMFSFWFYEISSWFYTISFIIEFFSGSLIPIDLLPVFLQNILRFLPFKYLVYFPVSILTNKLAKHEIVIGFCVQSIWIILMLILIKVVWIFGRKKYDAYGG